MIQNQRFTSVKDVRFRNDKLLIILNTTKMNHHFFQCVLGCGSPKND